MVVEGSVAVSVVSIVVLAVVNVAIKKGKDKYREKRMGTLIAIYKK